METFMTSLRKLLGLWRWSRVVLCFGLLATLITACSLLLDTGRNQCESDTDCDFISKQYTCQAGLCSDLGPRGCYAGTPSSTDAPTLQLQFKNQCSRAQVVPFANCERLGLCHPTDQLPPAIMPTPTGGGTTPPPPPPPTLECIDDTRQVVVVGGSTAIQPFLSVVAPLVYAQGFQIVYQPSGSCTGVAGLFSPDANKRVVKDIAGRYAVLFSPDGKTSPQCTFSTQDGLPPATPVALDVAASDVFASSCDPTYPAPGSAQIGQYFGPVQPMTFVVKSESKETSISAEMGHVVFGRGNTDVAKAPFQDPALYPYSRPSLYFVRNSGSGTQQMIGRAIKVDAGQWWGVDRGGSTQVQQQMQLINSADFDNAVGILSTDFADTVRGSLRILAFQDTGQLAAYYPDSTLTTRDKRSVRDGHYSIWGPVHFFAQLTTNGNTLPNAAAQALVSKFTATKLDQTVLDKIIQTGLVPPCAMTVKRDAEMGPLVPFISPAACGCYFEAKVPEGQAPASCQTCSGPTECPGDRPACNYGYCEPVPQ
jgi:ABC-type phosphate transport system substrate-binding protein